MAAFLPPSTNAQYHGHPLGVLVLGLVALMTIGPGLIHYVLPDGGAGVIAGLDLSRKGGVIIGVFAWAGATQIAWGLLLLTASLRYRSLTPLLLALLLLERALMALSVWVLKTGAGHKPPEAYGALAAVPILAIALWLALQRRTAPATG